MWGDWEHKDTFPDCTPISAFIKLGWQGAPEVVFE